MALCFTAICLRKILQIGDVCCSSFLSKPNHLQAKEADPRLAVSSSGTGFEDDCVFSLSSLIFVLLRSKLDSK